MFKTLVFNRANRQHASLPLPLWVAVFALLVTLQPVQAQQTSPLQFAAQSVTTKPAENEHKETESRATALDNAGPKTLRVYHVGNSITDMINYRGLQLLAESRGRTYAFGRHMIPGAPLSWIWEHPASGFKEDSSGYYPNALKNEVWDVLTLEPFDRHLVGKDGDLVMAKNFIDLALQKSPELRIYIYSRWPRRENDGALGYDKKWLRSYTGGWDNTEESRDYFEKVTDALRKAYPALSKRILLVPVGDVLYELNLRMKAGKVKGFKSVKELYADGIHLTNIGSYVVGCTFYATLFQDDPKGLPTAPYKDMDAELAAIIQDTVWQVVKAHSLAGIAPPMVEAEAAAIPLQIK